MRWPPPPTMEKTKRQPEWFNILLTSPNGAVSESGFLDTCSAQICLKQIRRCHAHGRPAVCKQRGNSESQRQDVAWADLGRNDGDWSR